MPEPTQCRYCPAQIIWLPTAKGKRMCIEVDGWDGEEEYQRGVHTPHWGNCAGADQARADVVAKLEADCEKAFEKYCNGHPKLAQYISALTEKNGAPDTKAYDQAFRSFRAVFKSGFKAGRQNRVDA